MSSGQNNFAFTNKLYQILSRKPGNVFFSPFSLHVLLAIAYQGARNVTLETIQKVLQIPAASYKNIIHHLTTLENVQLSIAFKINLKKEKRLLVSFENTAKDYFDSEVEPMDFTQNTETTRKTKNIIDEILLSLPFLTLRSTLYFKSDWALPFCESKTHERSFYLNDDDVVQVQMMKDRKKVPYKYDKDLDSQILILPYAGDEVHMVIILPKEKNGIGNLEVALSKMDLREVFTELRHRKVDVFLPRFKFERSTVMDDVVKEMGLGVIYDQDKADFTGVVELETGENLYVNGIVQQACIDVNEKGTEAAAVAGTCLYTG
ncbi:hypothetical protein Zmor_016147 [Zophobas morio]|uniref:Serpin domain-containing protein n=1 Tax=Zophobas morio TaxID=2755281 RepID=A0AA38IPZ5_9CUCU|nr:hypothetical protein Zmor_016147 [Zophobas morio]